MSEVTKVRLNIGAGDKAIPGFISIDAIFGHDVRKLPYENNSVDEIYSSHTLEHIHHSMMLATLAEWVRVLKPGGRIRIAVPDFDKILKTYAAGDMDPTMLAAWMHGSHDHDLDRHRNVITFDGLATCLRRLAIDGIETFEPEYKDCTKDPIAGPMSLNVQGYKRNIKVNPKPTVAMVLSTPRFGPVDLMDGIIDTARELGWYFRKQGGTEWGKGLTGAIMDAIEKWNPDYIMCLDYDSVFTADDCKEILRLMQENPDVGAIYPVEAHRHGDVPLGFDTGGAITYRGELTEVLSGHFGCTMLRKEMFDTLPHPWFYSHPDPNTGLWSKNNIDADITFWALAGLHGWKTCQANNVQIGHLELCVKWIKPTGIIWQPIQHYRANGKPPNAVFDGKYWEQFQIGRQRPQAAKVENGVDAKPFAKSLGSPEIHDIKPSPLPELRVDKPLTIPTDMRLDKPSPAVANGV